MVASHVSRFEGGLWDGIAADYDRVSRVSRPHLGKYHRVVEVLAQRSRTTWPSTSVLDLGCGSGVLANVLTENEHRGEYVGLDASEAMLTIARRRARSDNVSWMTGDLALPLPFTDETFDAVVSVNALFLAPRHTFALAEARRVLKAGGVLVLVMPKPETKGPGHLVRAHFSGMGFLRCAWEVAVRLPVLVAAVRLAAFQTRLDAQDRVGASRCMSLEQINHALSAAEFEHHSTEEVQAGENWLLTASRPAVGCLAKQGHPGK